MESTVFFESTSPTDAPPSFITVSFAQDPTGTLGAQLKNLDKVCVKVDSSHYTVYDNKKYWDQIYPHDYSYILFHFNNFSKGHESENFNPAYATIDRLISDDTIAGKCGLIPGDCIVAVNGEGFRRFAPDYEQNTKIDELRTNLDGSMNISFDEEAEETDTNGIDETEEDIEETKKVKRLKYRVIPSGMNGGEAYNALIREIKEIKSENNPDNPLLLSLERYGWDSRVNAWPRFLLARNNDVPMAMKMMQDHEEWKKAMFPIDLRRPGLRVVLNSNIITEVEFENVLKPPTVYVDFGKLINMEGTVAKANDILDSFVIHTELVLSRSSDPSRPKVSQLLDLSEVNVKNLRTSLLKDIYEIFEANYPETLFKMVMYPVTKAVVRYIQSDLFFFCYVQGFTKT